MRHFAQRILEITLVLSLLSTTPGCSGQPGYACSQVVPLASLVSPMNGATGVSDALSSLQVSGSTNGTFAIKMSSDTQITMLGGAMQTSAGNTVTLPALMTNTTYVVSNTTVATTGTCAMPSVTADIGTFTTR